MGYADRAALTSDQGFIGRLNACTANEAIGITSEFADRILAMWGYGASAFMGLVVSSPGFDRPQELITDGDLLSAVQAHWARAESIAAPPATP